MRNRKRYRLGGMIALFCFASSAVAYLPEEQPQPKPKPALERKSQPAPRPKTARKPHVKRHPLRPKVASEEPSKYEGWCQKKGGTIDEEGNCTKDLSAEECADVGGALNEQGVCIADRKICEEKGGAFNEYEECIFQ